MIYSDIIEEAKKNQFCFSEYSNLLSERERRYEQCRVILPALQNELYGPLKVIYDYARSFSNVEDELVEENFKEVIEGAELLSAMFPMIASTVINMASSDANGWKPIQPKWRSQFVGYWRSENKYPYPSKKAHVRTLMRAFATENDIVREELTEERLTLCWYVDIDHPVNYEKMEQEITVSLALEATEIEGGSESGAVEYKKTYPVSHNTGIQTYGLFNRTLFDRKFGKEHNSSDCLNSPLDIVHIVPSLGELHL